MSKQSPSGRTDGVNSPRRRRVLIGVGTGLVAAAGMGVGQVGAQSHDVTVSMDNVGFSAWEVTGVTGDEDVAPTGEENPTLTLQEGTRYQFENGGWSSHPLAFRDANDNSLLTQSGSGSLEGDADVNWVDNDETVAFTVTESLASELDDYTCTIHSSMNGDVVAEQTPDAAVTFTEQTRDGTTVTVDSVRMDDGGFVTMHDSSLLDGDATGSVVGFSEYLEPGTYDDVVVSLDDPIQETQQLIAMPHEDSNDNQEYDFVDGNGDPPYTDSEGAPITDGAEVTVASAPAAVTFTEQTTEGTSVTVDSVRMDEGGFVTMHDDTLSESAVDSVVGFSEYLAPGSYENVTVSIDEITETQQLIAMPHEDSNDNQEYDFVDGNGDPPYTDGDGAITDGAEVTVPSASVTFTDQTRDGTTVTVDSVRMNAGGFVTMHDSSLLDGEAVGSVVGFSEYLEPGSYEDVVVSLDDPIQETQQLIAMPHEDSNDNQTYDFVDGDGDPPYTDSEGAPITDGAEVTVASAPAAVTFSEQTRDGTTVTVDSVRMDEGGFVTMHDSSLLDGEAVGSVVGFSEYLAPGSYENVIVSLDDPIQETQQLIAMPHEDSNDNQTYDFVDGSGDPPYADGDGAITDGAEVTVASAPAAVTFAEQTTDGTSVTVDSVRMDEGGFVTMHDDTLSESAVDSVVGFSEYLAPGSYEDVSVSLDTELSMDQELTAMPHRDSNDNQTYDFVDGNGDPPYTDSEGAPITDAAQVTIEDDSSDGGIVAEAPGFGLAAGAAGLGGLAAYAYRKLNLDPEPPTPEEDGLEEDTE